MRNIHSSVIYRHSQLISVQPVGTTNDKITAFFRQVLRLCPVYAVYIRNKFIRHVQAQGRRFSFRPAFLGKTVTMTVIYMILAFMRSTADTLQTSPIAITGIDESVSLQPIQGLFIHKVSLTLHIRPVGTAHIGSFVPIQPQTSHISHKSFGKDTFRALFIYIFNAKDQSSLSLSRLQPAEKSRPNIAQVQISRGAGSKSTAHTRLLR